MEIPFVELWNGPVIQNLYVCLSGFFFCIAENDDFLGLDYPYITTLLPNNTIEIHSVETQAIVQVVPALPSSPSTSPTPQGRLSQRLRLSASSGGYLVPSTQRSDKMKMMSVPLVRPAQPVESEVARESNMEEAQPYSLE
jgi:hypothetical protein